MPMLQWRLTPGRGRRQSGYFSLRDVLHLEHLRSAIREKAGAPFAFYQCARYPDERAAWLSSFANEVVAEGELGFLRQKGGLSSLHIPREVPTHPIWEQTNAPHSPAPDHIRLQRDERTALEQHARGAGCRLIVNPDMDFPDLAKSAVLVRLKTLSAFLESMPDRKCEVAWSQSMAHNESVTIVGNWSCSHSREQYRGV